MQLRRATAWIATAMVAITVAFAVPVSQLRVASDSACCCPDPDLCRCADHEADPSSQPSMRACHNPERVAVVQPLPSFPAPVAVAVPGPARAIVAVEHAVPAPHPAPPIARPDAPS